MMGTRVGPTLGMGYGELATRLDGAGEALRA